MELIVDPSSEVLKLRLVESLSQKIIEIKDRPQLLLYSGGSGFDVLDALIEKLDGIDLSFLTLCAVDERFDTENSNYVLFKKRACFDKWEKSSARIIVSCDMTKNLKEMSDWYDRVLREEIEKVKMGAGKVFAIMGMGADGHTAGIFPYPEGKEFFYENFVDTDRYVFGYDVGDKNEFTKRLTSTFRALKSVDYAYGYVVGENKKDVLKRVMQNTELVHVLPAVWWNRFRMFNLYTG